MNSPLVEYTLISPNRTSPRQSDVWIFTPHCVVGQCTVESLALVFAPVARQASSNYGIDYMGRVGMYCEEKDRAWTTSSGWNDHRAITVEVASDTYHPYAMVSKAYDTLVNLGVDICKRYGKTRMLWLGSLQAVQDYAGKRAATDMVLTAHRWFAATACPGDWLYSREEQLANDITRKLRGEEDMTKAETTALINQLVPALIEQLAPAVADKSVRDAFPQLLAEHMSARAEARSSAEARGWSNAEYDDAIEDGITDGSRPQSFATREEVAIMAGRALAKALEQSSADNAVTRIADLLTELVQKNN